MLALDFFSLLHVPINVPALATSLKKDDLNMDRELRAHGISNALSGLLGSVQVRRSTPNFLLVVYDGWLITCVFTFRTIWFTPIRLYS